MKEELRNNIKSLAKSGAFRPLEQLAEELKSEIRPPAYADKQGKFIYESGRAQGQREGIEIFINELNQIAKNV